MSDEKKLDLEAVKARKLKAENLIRDLCRGEQRWRMSIPVKETDSDVVMQVALNDVSALIAALEAAQARIAELESPREGILADAQRMLNVNEAAGQDGD